MLTKSNKKGKRKNLGDAYLLVADRHRVHVSVVKGVIPPTTRIKKKLLEEKRADILPRFSALILIT